MPTSRAYSFVAASAVIYLFANQTQVGWLYVVSALLLGTVIAAWRLNRSALKGLTGTRKVGDVLEADLYEGDETAVELTLRKSTGASASHIRLNEKCPLVAPDDAFRLTKLFIPALPAQSAVQFRYDITLDRRGLHEFPPLDIASGAPFGMFRRKGSLSIPTRTLVYPEVRPLERLELLDRKLTAQIARPRAGVGYEVLGVRPYRTGDSPRHIHWRSVAKTNQLISKEFADEAQPGLTLIMDLFAHPYPQTETKHTPFEWAVKCAASIGDYARQKGYSLYLLSDDEALAAPIGAVAWMALLQYLARVQPTGRRSLADVIGQQVTQNFVAVILPWPDERVMDALTELHRQRIEVLAVILDPETFPEKGLSAQGFAGQLTTAGIETRLIQFGDDWGEQLF
jgi:uncharacterized protein (DUF58 family)